MKRVGLVADFLFHFAGCHDETTADGIIGDAGQLSIAFAIGETAFMPLA